MIDFTKKSPEYRRNALSVITLGVLVAGVAIAWLLSVAISPVREGERWYIVCQKGKEVGWEVSMNTTRTRDTRTRDTRTRDTRTRDTTTRDTTTRDTTRGATGITPPATDDMNGYQISAGQVGSGLSVNYSRWQLSADQDKGTYISGQVFYQPDGRVLDGPSTEIRLDRPKLLIRRHGSRKATPPVLLDVGDDYIPEGYLETLILEVAASGQDISGWIVLDEYMALFDVQLQSIDFDLQLNEVVVVQSFSDPRVKSQSLYKVSDGQIVSVDTVSEGVLVMQKILTDGREVVEKFPDASRIRDTIADVK